MLDVLHINDNRLLLQQGSEQFTSQGYALLAGEQVQFDFASLNLDSNAAQSAVKRCRLAPQEINNRYWLQCDQSAISANAAGMRHAADLIWQHLSQLKAQRNLNELVLVVPSHYRAENLQLLLGVAKACGLQIRALLNKAALALSARTVQDGDYLHHDVQLHQTVSSKLSVSGGMVTLGDVQIIQDVGIHLMQETLLKGLQNSFIQNDRFDPLHDAGTEQQLFDQLPHIAEQIAANAKANIGVEHQGQLHSTSLEAQEWHGLLSTFASRLAQASSGNTLLDLNYAFGTAALAGLDGAGVTVISGVPKVNIDMLIDDAQAGSAVIYQTDLALQAADRPAKAAPKASAKTPVPNSATHLLNAGKAVAINQAEVSLQDNSLSVSRASSSNVASLLSGGQLFIMNDEGRTQLRPNDRLGSHLADGVIAVIQVIE